MLAALLSFLLLYLGEKGQQLLVVALGRIQGNLKFEFGDD